MREAVGNALLLNLVVIFMSLVMLFFVGILSYSKAYRTKNRIVEIIEKHENYNENAIEEINADLKSIGYSSGFDDKCTTGDLNTTTYKYCIYEVCQGTLEDDVCKGERYYKVETYVHFEFPVIGDRITFPVRGETKILGKSYDYE